MRILWAAEARIRAILHKLTHPGHELVWRRLDDSPCPGDIVCETCNSLFWCRLYDLSEKKRAKLLGFDDEN